MDEARPALGEAAFEGAGERGWMMTFEQAVAYALEDHDAPPNQEQRGAGHRVRQRRAETWSLTAGVDTLIGG